MAVGKSPRRRAGRPTVHLIPHTHWDREWYLPAAVFRRRLVRALDELIPMLERDASLRFTLDGQTVLLEDYFVVRPTMRPRIARLVARGRLAIGPWYVLADELIPTPASLRANLAFGIDDARQLGGAMPVLYSPDAFGHPGCLPDLATERGLRFAVIWRGLADRATAGRDLVRWRGDGGGSVLAHHLPRDGYEVGAHLPALDRARLRLAWETLEPQLAARASTGHLALPIGADHHAPHPRLPKLRAALARIDARYRFRVSRWDEYFEGASLELHDPPEVSGELRSSYGHCWTLQGVHSTRARLKRLHGQVESRIQRGLVTLVERLGDATARAELAGFERTLIRCQFHDTIAGTVCDEAAREQLVRLQGLDAATADAIRELLRRAADHRVRHGLALFNPAARSGRTVVETKIGFFRRDVLVGPPGDRRPRTGPGGTPFSLRDERGRVVPVQVLARRRALDRLDRRYGYPDLDEIEELELAVDPGVVPSRGVRTLAVGEPGRAPSIPSRTRARGSGRALENRLIRAEVARNGTVTLVDRIRRRRYPGLLDLEVAIDRGDLYTPSLGRAHVSRVVGLPRLLADGPLLASLELPWRLGVRGRGSIRGRTRFALAREEDELRVVIEVEQRAREVRLRLGFPISAGGPAIVGTGERLIRRDDRRVAPIEERAERHVPTAPAHDLVSVGNRKRGLTLRHEGHFEYQWQAGERLSLTLLRAVAELSRASLPERPGHAAWPTATPDALEQGTHRVELRLRPGGIPSVRSAYPDSGVGMLVAEIVGDDRARDHDQDQRESGR